MFCIILKYCQANSVLPDLLFQQVTTKQDENGLPMQLLTLNIPIGTLSRFDYGNYTCYAAGDKSEDETLVLLTSKLSKILHSAIGDTITKAKMRMDYTSPRLLNYTEYLSGLDIKFTDK